MIRSRYRALNTIMSLASGFTGILDKFSGAVAAYSTRKLKTSYPTTLPADYGGGAAAAYSLRKVKSDYEGSAVKVRRSSDGGLQDIGFDANGDLDTTALLAFVGGENLLLQSEDFTTSWSLDNVISTANVTTDPNGTENADLLDDGTASSTQHWIYQSSSFSNSTTYTLSFYAKYQSRQYMAVNIYNGSTSQYVYFDIQNGSIYGSTGDVTASITSVGNGWYRVVYTRTMAATGSPNFRIAMADDSRNITYTGSNKQTYIWGAQLEEGTTATTYNKTTTGIGGDGHVTRWYSQSDPVDTYTADFSGGADNFVANGDNTATGGLSITDEYGTTIDNVLELNCKNTNDTEHPLRKNNPFGASNPINGKTLKCSFKMLVPLGQTGLVSATLSDGNLSTAGIVSDGKVAEQGRWTTFTDVAWTQTALQSRLIFMGLDSSDDPEFVAVAGEKFYIADVVLTETVDAYNGTGSQQPLIVEGGDVVLDNGKPIIKTYSTAHFDVSATLNTSNAVTQFFVGKSEISGVIANTFYAGGNKFILASKNGDTVTSFGTTPDASYLNGSSFTFTNRDVTYDNTTAQSLISLYWSNPSFDSLINIGWTSTSWSMWSTQELIIFNSDQSTNRKDIEWNINKHYSIYDQWDRESCMNVRRSSDNVTQDIGFSGKNINQTQLESFVNDASPVLDDYTGDDAAVSAYSLRKVRSAYTGSAINVRRSSDDEPQDIGFDANGDLDTAALLAFVNEDVDVYTSDFSLGIDGLIESRVTASSVDAISDGTTSKDDVLQSVLTSGSNTHYIYRNGTFDLSNTYDVSFEYYIPSVRPDGVTPQTIDGIVVRTGTGSDGAYPFSVLDSWESETIQNWSPSTSNLLLFAAAVGEFIGSIDADGDVYYLKNIVVTQTTADGHVTTWYDQAGNKNAQAPCSSPTACEQPLIVEAGDVVLENGKPAMSLDEDQYFQNAGVFGYSRFDFFSVSKITDTKGMFLSHDTGGGKYSWVYTENNTSTTTSGSFGTPTMYSNSVLQSISTRNDVYNAYNGHKIITTLGGDTSTWTDGFFFGYPAFQVTGTVQEIICFDSDKSTTRLSIEGNIGRYYNITGYRDGFVSKWYDQSGAYNHAENSTHDEQPQIVSNGSMLEENGKAAIDFDGVDDNLQNPSLITNTTHTIVAAFVDVDTRTFKYFYDGGGSVAQMMLGTAGNEDQYRYSAGGTGNFSTLSGTFADPIDILSFAVHGTTSQIAINGALNLSGESKANPSAGKFNIGESAANSLNAEVKFWEIIVFASDQSTNREDIEKNINTHFKIYS